MLNTNITKIKKTVFSNHMGATAMQKFTKRFFVLTLCTMFVSMQLSFAAIETGLNNATIDSYSGGFAGVEQGTNSATLNFKGSSVVNWNDLNVGKNESLNFNAIDGAKGLTVVNKVIGGNMSQIYGNISSNDGISRLIISNPSGILFDGAHFTTAGDLMLTTQAINANYVNGNINITGADQEAIQGVIIKSSDLQDKSTFNVGGSFDIIAPSVDVANSVLKAGNGIKFLTADGQSFLACPTTSNTASHSAVRMESVSVDGDVYIASGKDIVKIVNGSEIKGDLTVVSDGNVALNYANEGQKLHVTGNVDVKNDGRTSFLRNSVVDGNLNMANSGGYLEINDVKVLGNADLKTTVETNPGVKHFVHVIGDTQVDGDLNIDSIHNIHIGGYNSDLHTFREGNLKVGGDLNALAREGSVTVTIDTQADKVNLESGTLNVLTDGKAVIKANDYKFKAKNYIGGVDSTDELVSTMENYKPLPNINKKSYVQIEGGNVSKVETTGTTGYAFVRSKNDMNVNGVKVKNINLAADQADIVIGDDVHADIVLVEGETKNLTVELPSRDYTLKYTDIKDTEVITIAPDTTITYEMANGDEGWNKGTQTADNTYLVVPGDDPTPPNPPIPNPPPVIDNENIKVLNNLAPDRVSTAIDAGQVYTPIAFAADLDDEEDTGVRKNVDGSVTVVRPFTPTK